MTPPPIPGGNYLMFPSQSCKIYTSCDPLILNTVVLSYLLSSNISMDSIVRQFKKSNYWTSQAKLKNCLHFEMVQIYIWKLQCCELITLKTLPFYNYFQNKYWRGERLIEGIEQVHTCVHTNIAKLLILFLFSTLNVT